MKYLFFAAQMPQHPLGIPHILLDQQLGANLVIFLNLIHHDLNTGRGEHLHGSRGQREHAVPAAGQHQSSNSPQRLHCVSKFKLSPGTPLCKLWWQSLCSAHTLTDSKGWWNEYSALKLLVDRNIPQSLDKYNL